MDSKKWDHHGGTGDHSDLYSTIRSLANTTTPPFLIKVSSASNSSSHTVQNSGDRMMESIPESSDSSLVSASVSASKNGTERCKTAESIVNQDDGSIRMHCLSSNEQVVIPETTGGNLSSFETPRSKTAFISPVRRSASRPTTATSGLSLASFASTRTSTFQSKHEAVYPGTFTSGSVFSPRIISTSSMVVNQMPGRQADEQEEKLRRKFQQSNPTEEYNEWRVGMDDPTEESRQLHELSDMFYYVDKDDEGTYKYNLLYGWIAEYNMDFVRMPTPPGFNVQCRITRSRKGIDGKLYPTYFMHLERDGKPEILLLTAQRTNLLKRDYVISTNPAELSPKSKFCAGILESNIRGSDFVLKIPVPSDYIDNGHETVDGPKKQEWEEFMFLKFEPNALGIKGPRRLSVSIPKLKSDWEQCHPGTLTFPGGHEDNEYIAVMKNRVPKWSGDTCTYVLNFSTRVQTSSVKNFQMAEGDFTLLQFGRSGKRNSFILDFAFPFCPLQAFGIGLSSFDIKWGLE